MNPFYNVNSHLQYIYVPVLIIALLAIGQSGVSQDQPNSIAQWLHTIEANHPAKNAEIVELLQSSRSRPVPDADFLSINKQRLYELIEYKPAVISIEIPRSQAQKVVLKLALVDIVAPEFAVNTDQTENVVYQEGLHYRGIVDDNGSSIAAFSIFDNEIMGFFSDGQNNYTIGKMEGKDDVTIIYNSRELQLPQNWQCHTEDLDHVVDAQDYSQGTRGINCKTVKVYFEADKALYLSKGSSIDNVTNYVTGLFNQVATIYALENIKMQISTIHVWTSTDPFVSYTSTATLLTEFKNYRGENWNGNLAHLLTTRNIGGGRASLDVICTKASAFGVSQIANTYENVPTFSPSVKIIAHELGHNLGSPHTQSCTWVGGALDNCATVENASFVPSPGLCPPGPAPTNGGTIMSYCHLVQTVGINFSLGFGALPGNLIRSKVQNASCLTGSCSTNNINLVVLGGSVQEGAVVSVKLTSTSPLSAAKTFTLTASGTANAADFKLSGTSLTIPSGSTVSNIITLYTLNDAAVEPAKTCVLTASGTASTGMVFETMSRTVTINSDDAGSTDGVWPAFSWAVSGISTTAVTATAQAVARDASGNVYVTGNFTGAIDFDPGPLSKSKTSAGSNDIFVAKYNASGDFQWVQRIGSTSSDVGRAIAVDGSGNVYVTGEFKGTVDFNPSSTDTANLKASGTAADIFVLKLTTAGVYQWAKRMGGTQDDDAKGVTLDNAGNVVVTGYFQGKAYFNPANPTGNFLESAGSYDIFVAKYSAALGVFGWAKRMGGTGGDIGYDVTVDDSGNVVATGYFTGTVGFNPASTSVAYNLASSAGSSDVFVLKLSASGSYVSAFRLGSTGSDVGYGVKTDASGNLYLAGKFSNTVNFNPAGTTTYSSTSFGSADAFFAKYNASYARVWHYTYGTTVADQANGITVDNQGNAYIVGQISTRAFVYKVSSNGANWSSTIDTSAIATAITVNPSSGAFQVVGSYKGMADFNGNNGIATYTAKTQQFFITHYSSAPGLAPLPSDANCAGYRTETQAFWGQPANANNQAILQENFSDVFPNGLVLGEPTCGYMVMLSSAQSVQDLLPSGGIPIALTQHYTDPGASLNNKFLGQVAALALNVSFDLYIPDFRSDTVDQALESLYYNEPGPFYGWTVRTILDTAQRVLAGCSSAYTAPAIHGVVSNINANYNGGAVDLGYLTCSHPESAFKKTSSVSLQSDEGFVSVMPNPFSATTTLQLTLPADDDRVTLDLYTATGQHVINLFVGPAEAGRTYSMQADLRHLPNGLFRYRLVTSTEVTTGQLIKIR